MLCSIFQKKKTTSLKLPFHVKRRSAPGAVRVTVSQVVCRKSPLRQNGTAVAGAARYVVRFHAQYSATVTKWEKWSALRLRINVIDLAGAFCLGDKAQGRTSAIGNVEMAE